MTLIVSFVTLIGHWIDEKDPNWILQSLSTIWLHPLGLAEIRTHNNPHLSHKNPYNMCQHPSKLPESCNGLRLNPAARKFLEGSPNDFRNPQKSIRDPNNPAKNPQSSTQESWKRMGEWQQDSILLALFLEKRIDWRTIVGDPQKRKKKIPLKATLDPELKPPSTQTKNPPRILS